MTQTCLPNRTPPTGRTSLADPHRLPVIDTPFTENGAAGQIAQIDLVPAQLLDGDEIVIFAVKPSLWYVLFTSARWLIVLGVLVALTAWFGWRVPGLNPPMVIKAAVALAGARLGFALLQWVSRLYVLTNRRVMRLRGIFNIDLFECQLSRIQNTYLTIRWYERLAGLGSIAFATAGTCGLEASWGNLNHPLEIHERLRSAINRAQKTGNSI